MGNNLSGHKHRLSLDDDPLSSGYDPYDDDSVISIVTESTAVDAIADQLRDSRIYDSGGRPTLYADGPSNTTESNEISPVQSVPTVFKWVGNGKDVYISGTFNGWKSKIPMVRSSSKQNFYTIIDLPLGEHQYKFIIDGHWKLDQAQPVHTSPTGIQNNVIQVKESDFDVLAALSHDMANSRNAISDDSFMSVPVPLTGNESLDLDSVYLSRNVSPPGDYNRIIPNNPTEALTMHLTGVGANFPLSQDSKKLLTPPLLPPQLLQVILNRDTSIQCDPNILPLPNHVMVNHMYALSIKDGVIVLSAITRYRQKFVSAVLYKPI